MAHAQIFVTRDLWSMVFAQIFVTYAREVQNQGQKFVTRDLEYGHVPQGDQGSDREDAGKVQLTKYVSFSFVYVLHY